MVLSVGLAYNTERRPLCSFANPILIVVAVALFIAPNLVAQNTAAGTWRGTLPKADLPLVFQFNANGSGSVDSPKQNFHAAATASIQGTDVTISVPSVQGTFTGTLKDGQMTGTWTQGSGYSDNLVLKKD